MMIRALLEVIGVASILPFMQLAAAPDAIQENEWLSWLYELSGFETNREMLIASGVVVLLLLMIANAFAIFTVWLQQRFAWNTVHNVSIRLLKNYLSQPYAFFLKYNTSDLRTKIMTEAGQLSLGILIPLSDLIARSLVAIVIFVLLLLVNPQIAMTAVLVLGGAYGLIYFGRRKLMAQLGQDRIDANMKRFRSLNEVMTGIKTVSIYGALGYFFQRYEKSSKLFSTIMPRVQLVMISPRYIIEVFAIGGILAATLFLLIQRESLVEALPILTLYALAGYRLLPALQQAFAAAIKLKHTMPILDSISEDLLLKAVHPTVGSQNGPRTLFKNNIRLKDISFQYAETNQNVLSQVDVVIPKGHTVAFVGETGSGKTTLIDLIVGLLQSTEGGIYIDDQPLDASNAKNWQQQIGYVPQDVFLFDDTIGHNIAIGLAEEDIDKELLEKMAKIANIHEFIVSEMPDGYNSDIGERGVRLSGGQRQRLGLARALYRQPSVLVLDEATSALDGITESAVIEALKEASNDLTVIIIAHRLSTVRHADCIYLLKDGHLAAEGSYDSLLHSNEVFRAMVNFS